MDYDQNQGPEPGQNMTPPPLETTIGTMTAPKQPAKGSGWRIF